MATPRNTPIRGDTENAAIVDCLIDVESLTRAAEAAADALPTPATERQRLVFGRIQSLVTKTSQQASTSLRLASAQVAAFTAEPSVDRSTTD